MLKELSIKNYAIIEELRVSFDSEFITVTGETGAGKSILLGALGLVLGERAKLNILGNPDQKAVIEAVFDVAEYNLQSVFDLHDLDYERHTILRREIIPSGKSRSFVNDTPVKLDVLNAIASKLVDIHSQNDSQTLKNARYRLELVDYFAGIEGETNAYQNAYKELKVLKKQLEDLRQKEREAGEEEDFLQFKLNELEEGLLPAEEFNGLENRLKVLEHAEEIKSGLYGAVELLSESEENALSALRSAGQSLQSAAEYKDEVKALAGRLESALIELEDLSNELNAEYGEVEVDPAEREIIKEKLDAVYALQHKYRVNDFRELEELKNETAEKLSGFTSLTNDIQELEDLVNQKSRELIEHADTLSQARRKPAAKLSKKITSIVASLGMEKAVFEVHFSTLPEPGPYGIDEVKFLFCANLGGRLEDLSVAASGGELSRVMLAIKRILSEHKNLPTVIFDEIDTGVSGSVAGKLAAVLSEMTQNMQVIAITHLPQVAAKGKLHLNVHKHVKNGKTVTEVQPLSGDQRVNELAGMLSGEQKTEAAIENAKVLLKAAD